MAAFHTMHSAKVSVPEDVAARKEFHLVQRKELLPYFQYDDGVDHCVGNTEGTSLQKLLDDGLLEFKKHKMTLLETIANDPLKWIVSLPPRTVNVGSNIPFYTKEFLEKLDEDMGLMAILSTCRLLALTKEDYHGRAKDILEALIKKYNSGDEKFRMIPGAAPLEYRARVWLKRLATAVLQSYQACPTTSSSAAEEAERLLMLQATNASMPEIMESNIRLAELQTLELLIAYSNQYMEKEKDAAKHIHDEPCSMELSNSLLALD